MKNIIIVGDSFCACDAGWPGILPKMLNLELINYGRGGQHWWGVADFLSKLSQETLDNCEVIIFAHTEDQRIPNCTNKTLSRDEPDYKNELQLAMDLYFKYIHEDNFLTWAQIQWYKEVSEKWRHIKLINLHGFPSSLAKKQYLDGVNVFPNLLSLSLNEGDYNPYSDAMMTDSRLNHFNEKNNIAMAEQLYDIIQNYQPGDVYLDISKFEQVTDRWTNWGGFGSEPNQKTI